MAELVLLAEDDELLRAAIVAHLRAAGFQTVDVPDGNQALDAVRATDFDLIVLDRRMEGLDGLGVLVRLCEQAKRAGLIVILDAKRGERKERKALTKAEAKAKRDARYAARKARRG